MIWVVSCLMVHYVNQLVTNSAYLLFGVGEVWCWVGLSMLSRSKQLPPTAGNNHSEKGVVCQNTKTMKMRKKSLKSLLRILCGIITVIKLFNIII